MILNEIIKLKILNTLTKKSDVSILIHSPTAAVAVDITNDINNKKAIAKMTDGKTFEVYYTPELVPANKEYDPTFSTLPGLAIQYEIESGKMKFKYTLSKINYDAVQVSLFDFPVAGYRVMTYEENQNLKKGN